MNWTEPQRRRLTRFNAPRCVDMHCHCLPGLDDGPEDMESALAMCRALAADGITTVVATPHQLGSYEGQNSPEQIAQAAAELMAELEREEIPLEILAGGDVRVDPRLPKLLAEGRVSCLAARVASPKLPVASEDNTGNFGLATGNSSGNWQLTTGNSPHRYLLIELPTEVMINLHPLIQAMGAMGVRMILSHPERHAVLPRQPMHLLGWIERGVLLQVTAGSLLGDFGPAAQRSSWDWLGSGLVSLVATDAHGAEFRPPRLSAAIEAVSAHLGHVVARRICLENPLRVCRGEEIAVSVQRRMARVSR